MEDLGIGKLIIRDKDQDRDAIHVAVAPVTAYEQLRPGQHVGFKGDGVGVVEVPIGIVDPFLEHKVFPGQKFWMFLYPGSITSLRHDWTHPAFESGPLGELRNVPMRSVEYLRDFAHRIEMSYEELMKMLKEYVEGPRGFLYTNSGENEMAEEELWLHYEKVTGAEVPDNKRGDTYFSCSC